MSKRIPDLDIATKLEAEDQFIFYQNSTQKTKRVSRNDMLNTPGFTSSIPDIPGVDTVAPAKPTFSSIVTAREIDNGVEKIFIRAKANANSETDLESYGWSIRRVSGTPVFSGGALTGYGGTGQIFEEETSNSPAVSGVGPTKEWVVKPATWYEIRICAIDKNGNHSDYTDLENTTPTVILTTTDNTAPAAITDLAATSAIKTVFLTWTLPSDSDLSYNKIYRNTTGTAPTIGSTAAYSTIKSSSFVDSSVTQGQMYYYWVTTVDLSGNESLVSNRVNLQPGLVAATDITTFAVDATKMYTNTIVLKDAVWSDNSPSSGYISWNAHTVVYNGASYSISSGNTNLQFVYWTGGTSYSTSDTNPTLSDGQFMIATNAKNSSNVATGLHDLAWNALANAVIGTAYIQNAAINNAKISDLSADKITTGTIDAGIITLIGDSVIKSSSATSGSSGTGLWIKGATGGAAEFAIGDLAGTNYGYLKWGVTSNVLEIKGDVKATTGWFGSSSTRGVLVSASGLEIKGSTASQEAAIRANIDWTNSGSGSFTPSGTSGFYLGGAGNAYQFFIGNTGTDGLGATQNYLYWNGSALKMGGNIVAGSTVGSSGDTNFGLTVNSQYGIRRSVSNGTLTITGGDGNGVQYAAQIDLVGSFYNTSGTSGTGDGTGQLILQAGYNASNSFNGPFDGAIVFRTSLNNSGATANVGKIRMYIALDGTVVVGDANDTVYSGAPDAGSGNLLAENSITAGGSNLVGSNSNGLIYVKNNSNTTTITLTGSSGDVSATSFTTSSSKRFKTNIKKLKFGLEEVKKLMPVSFKRKGYGEKNDIGLIAEDVQKLIPAIVGYDEQGNVSGLDYSKLTPILIQAIKELSLEIEKLKKKIK